MVHSSANSRRITETESFSVDARMNQRMIMKQKVCTSLNNVKIKKHKII